MNPEKFSHRKSRARLCFKKAGGGPLSAETVELRQTRHEFLFGCGGFDAVNYAGGKPDERRTVAAAKYYAERGVVTKGHPFAGIQPVLPG